MKMKMGYLAVEGTLAKYSNLQISSASKYIHLITTEAELIQEYLTINSDTRIFKYSF